MTSTLTRPTPHPTEPGPPASSPRLQYNGQPTSWRPDILLGVCGLHVLILGLFLMMPSPTVHKPKTIEPKPLHMVMLEPINAPLVAPSGTMLEPSKQALPPSQTTPLPPVTQPVPKPAVKPSPVSHPVAMPLATSSPVNTPPASTITSPVATSNASAEHAIAVPVASGGSNKTQPSGETSTPAAASASSSAPGNSSSPPRFGVAYLNNPAPKYPSSARRMGEEGKVLLRVLVSADGLAKQVRLRTSSGSDALDDAAQAAVRKWRFIPAKLNGDTVEAWVQVPIVFKLDN